jgi:hypothetical protein
MENFTEGTRRLSAGIGLVVVLLVAAVSSAAGAEWSVGASITERFSYDSNVRLSTSSEESAWGFSTLPTITVEGRTPRLDLRLNAGLEYTFHEGAEDLDSFDQRGNASLGYNWQRARLNLSGSIVHATTRTTELEDTGQNFTDAERLIFSGSGSWSYLATQRDRIGVRGNASRSIADTSAIQDYSSYGGGLFWSRQLSEKDTLEVSGNYSHFIRTSGLDLESDTASGRLTYNHEFSPRLKTSVHGGGRYTETDEKVFDGVNIVSRDEASSGFLAGLSLTYLMERGEFTGSYERSIEPSGAGRLQERDSVRLSTNYKATPNITLDVSGVFTRQDSASDVTSDERKYVSTEPGVSWQFYRNLHLRMSYRFRTQKLDGNDDWAVSHAALASLAWRMPAKNLTGGE